MEKVNTYATMEEEEEEEEGEGKEMAFWRAHGFLSRPRISLWKEEASQLSFRLRSI